MNDGQHRDRAPSGPGGVPGQDRQPAAAVGPAPADRGAPGGHPGPADTGGAAPSAADARPGGRLFRAMVEVQLKDGALDPQGQALSEVLRSLGYRGLTGARVGKHIQIWLRAVSAEDTASQVDSMCRRVLANPVLETYRFRVEEEVGDPR